MAGKPPAAPAAEPEAAPTPEAKAAVLLFVRCDCNQDEKCDLADAATVLAQQFDGFPVECEDACDVNDDGKINLADSVYILNYLFKMGPDPLPPFPVLAQYLAPGGGMLTSDETGIHYTGFVLKRK